jgi:hypothetical protein
MIIIIIIIIIIITNRIPTAKHLKFQRKFVLVKCHACAVMLGDTFVKIFEKYFLFYC